MAPEYERDQELRAVRRSESSTATAYIIGALLVGAFISMLLFFAYDERTGNPITVSPPTTAPVTQPRTATPPANTTPAPAPSAK